MKSTRFDPCRLKRPVGRSEVIVALLVACVACNAVHAASFAARISPPRFELSGDPGDVLRQVVEIGNADSATAQYVIRTADWDLNEDGGVTVHPPELQPGSCRPWTVIERRTVTLAPDASKRYRFEVRIPDGAPTGECRFALLIAPDPDSSTMARMGNIQFPVAGQIAVVVYVSVGDAGPDLEFQGLRTQDVNGRGLPVAVFHNAGNAHGRPVGLLEGRDADGQLLDFIVSPAPILPGSTKAVALWPQSPDDPEKAVEFKFPLRLRGPIEWDGGNVDVDTTITD